MKKTLRKNVRKCLSAILSTALLASSLTPVFAMDEINADTDEFIEIMETAEEDVLEEANEETAEEDALEEANEEISEETTEDDILEETTEEIIVETTNDEEINYDAVFAPYAVSATTDRVWNFSDPMFDTLAINPDNITYNYICFGGLILKADDFKFMQLMETYENIYGNIYTRYLNLEGQAMNGSRQLEFMTYGDADIYITARSSERDTFHNRYLIVEDANGNRIARRNVGKERDSIGNIIDIHILKIPYRGSGEKITIYSEDSGINIFNIAVKSRANQNTTAAINKRWHISDFPDISYYRTNPVSVDGLTVLPYTSTFVDGEMRNGFDYNKCITLGGQNFEQCSTTEGEVYFDVPGVEGASNQTTDIYIAARSLGTNNKIQVVDEFGNLIGEEVVGSGDIETKKFVYTGSSARIYLRTNINGLRIYDIFAKTRITNTNTINKTWNMSSNLFKNIGYSDNSRTIDGLTILGPSNVTTKNATLGNNNYTHILAISGRGIEERKGVKFDVPGNVRVKVVAQSSSSKRHIVLTDEMNYKNDENEVTGLNEYEFTYDGGTPTTLYLRSLNSSFYIYKIQVESI